MKLPLVTRMTVPSFDCARAGACVGVGVDVAGASCVWVVVWMVIPSRWFSAGP
jgi:hypothetical protein